MFLAQKKSFRLFKIVPSSETKYSHTSTLIHPDQVERELTDAIAEGNPQILS